MERDRAKTSDLEQTSGIKFPKNGWFTIDFQIPLLRSTPGGGNTAHDGSFVKSICKLKDAGYEMGDYSLEIVEMNHQMHHLEDMTDEELEPLFKAMAQKHHLPSIATERMSSKHKRDLLISSQGCGEAQQLSNPNPNFNPNLKAWGSKRLPILISRPPMRRRVESGSRPLRPHAKGRSSSYVREVGSPPNLLACHY